MKYPGTAELLRPFFDKPQSCQASRSHQVHLCALGISGHKLHQKNTFNSTLLSQPEQQSGGGVNERRLYKITLKNEQEHGNNIEICFVS